MPNGPESDQILMKAIETAAAMSGHPELTKDPLVIYGISAGAPQASGFTTRHPESVAGLFLKVPLAVSPVPGGAAELVPTYVVLAELDAIVDNASLKATFERNRGSRALWALAIEPGVIHHSLTPAQRQLTINWMKTIVDLRLPPVPGRDPLRTYWASQGWLGNRDTREIESVGYLTWMGALDDWELATWLPTEATAREWAAFTAPSH
jgi:pimeloyl-ACP methyl ester carboxylesterase